MDRDAISGWGVVVHVIEKDKVAKSIISENPQIVFVSYSAMDRHLRLSGAGLGGTGGAQQPADAPVVDTAEQVRPTNLICTDHKYDLCRFISLRWRC